MRHAWITVALVLLAGCGPAAETKPPVVSPSAADPASDDPLVQFSLIAALATGDYDNGTPLRELLASGDFGLGTFDRLDGEMILLDGKIFQALSDGSVRPADLDGKTPFAEVTHFHEDGRIEKFAAATLEDLDTQLDRKLPRRNSPYALRIDGEFRSLTVRSVPAQSPPYRPLVEVVKNQPTWQHQNVRGTLMGFRCPSWVGTLNVAGYHWHFLSDDRKIGGHLLACDFQDATFRYDECTSISIRIPSSPQFDRFDVRQINDQDIEAIERKRTTK